MNNQIINVNIDKIVPNVYQPRRVFDEDALKELSESIKEHGIVQPITVRRIGDTFEIVAGERRFRAAKIAGLSSVPCNIIEITDCESAQIALLENLQRQDLNYIEEAQAYFNLIQDYKFTQDEIAKKMGKKQSTIANKLRLLKLSEDVRDLCLQNSLTERHARALLSVTDYKLQTKIVNLIIKNKLNVKESEKLIKKYLGKEKTAKEKKRKIKGVIPGKLYINSIRKIFEKLKVDAKYDSKEDDDFIEVTIKIPKN
ncbi:nucleoid occlusion protein [Clostridium sp. BJN0001]|uniref:nucleoid occlusion protein n=1 Tax=Clostridium sp. BJN0001 TaxID=2930219 RepID=UPI001FCFC414|nr:nucleoid occlusion protein [Clostridium sp. BJN0001]